MGTKRTIKAAEIIKAMKAVISDTQLMVKFNLPTRQFHIVVREMKQRGLLSGARQDGSNSNSDAGSDGIPEDVSDGEVLDR